MKTPTLENLISVWQSATPERRAAMLNIGQNEPIAAAVEAEGKALTIAAAAVAAGVSRMTVHRAVKSGALRVIRPFAGANPRITERELKRWLSEGSAI